MLYNYKGTQQPSPGAMGFAFVPSIGLPVFSLPGPGTPYSFRWNVRQPEQVYYNQSLQMVGLNGVVTGQMARRPLLDTRGVFGAEG